MRKKNVNAVTAISVAKIADEFGYELRNESGNSNPIFVMSKYDDYLFTTKEVSIYEDGTVVRSLITDDLSLVFNDEMVDSLKDAIDELDEMVSEIKKEMED